ncbi:serine/threonine protein kinase [Actinomadura sp. GC306]|nr:serine/threonine protein kinase [Actinomadura sp. GC306]
MLAGRYRLTSLLGRGGMGAVWHARDERLDREVAVKELRLPERLTEEQRRTWSARLDREARAAARLKHPGIVTVHDRITGEDGRPWIVMELVHGRSLADLVEAEGPLPPHRVAQIGLQVLDALRAAHRAGITHRDVKPANVLLESQRVVLTDFGIAAVDGDATLTRTGAVIGTPAFMSPEQVRGLEAGPASDLWSLGATLYAAVEGRPPFDGANTGAVFVAIATEDPPPAVRAGALGPTIMALLQRDADRRPTGEQLRAGLAHLAQEPAVAPAPAAGPAPPRRRRGRPVLIATAVAVALALTAAVAVSAFKLRSDAERDQAARDAYRALTEPPGPEKSMDEVATGELAVTYELCPGTEKCDVAGRVTATMQWLAAQNGVRVVYPPAEMADCGTREGCLISVASPSLTGARIVQSDDRLLLRVFVRAPR